MAEAMIDGGYSKKTARTPTKLTESPGFRWLAEKAGLTDEEIIKPVQRALNAKARFYNKRTARLEEAGFDDHETQLKAAQLGAKLLGSGEINKTMNESRSIKIEVKAKDSSENLIAGLLAQAYRKS